MSRKANKYYVTIPVDDWQIARLLGSETNWKILELLREVGIEGLSAEEISKKIEVPKPSVYSILSKLVAAKYVESTTKRQPLGRPPKGTKKRFRGKPTRVFIQNVPWGVNELDVEFVDSLDPILHTIEKDLDELRKNWLSIIEKIISAYQTNDLKKFFPEDSIHEKCGNSHEGLEFLNAITDVILCEIMEGKDFEALARKYKFMK